MVAEFSVGQSRHERGQRLPPLTPPSTTKPTPNLALNQPAKQSSTSQWSQPNDARGAVDGNVSGGYGFHTESEPNAWWQVDLGAVKALAEIRIFNRRDCCSELGSWSWGHGVRSNIPTFSFLN